MSALISNSSLSRPWLLFALVGVLLMGGTTGLWAYYGTAVFFEMVRAGFVACF